MSAPLAPLPWHAALWQRLGAIRAQERLGHAWLLSGPQGVGKRRFATAWAAALLCERGGEQACGVCRSCVQLGAGNHPNLMWLRPEVDAKTGKEKRDIGIGQLRELGQRLQLSSHYGQRKIGVLDPADALNDSGVNALLKTIEEPPGDSLLILISERPMALAATLRSRCQRLSFAVPDADQALDWLRSEHPGVEGGAELLAAAGGAPLRLLSWVERGLPAQRDAWRAAWLSVALRGQDPMAAAQAIAGAKDKSLVVAWFSEFYGFCLHLLRARLGLGQDADTAELAGRVGLQGLEALTAEALEAPRRLAGNVHPQLLAESLMIAWWRWTRARR